MAKTPEQKKEFKKFCETLESGDPAVTNVVLEWIGARLVATTFPIDKIECPKCTHEFFI